jgi:hypothetical protein
MNKKETVKKVEGIRVLDKGRNMDDLDILQFICCSQQVIPYRYT